jgi:hypothetical protein
VIVIFAGILFAFNELMKGAGLISRTNRDSYHAALEREQPASFSSSFDCPGNGG